MDVYKLIDRVPEMPYFLMALAYAVIEPERATQVFPSAFVFLAVTITVGLLMKASLKTQRPVVYPGIPIAKYDVPSLHTAISVGAVSFIYFMEPVFTIVFTPIAFVYMYSRIRLGFHTRLAVYTGVVVGFLAGSAVGYGLSGHVFSAFESFALSIMFFLVPVSATVFRLRYLVIETSCRPKKDA